MTFSDRLIASIERTRSVSVVGLDPRIDQMPRFITREGNEHPTADFVQRAITRFHEIVLDVVADLVPAIKPQAAFFEQYGIGGLQALANTIRMAKERGLLVILDAKRGDIGSTAEAYASAYLGDGEFGVDCITVNPYLGRDSLHPFVEACRRADRGLFVLAKTSNAGSGDLQDVREEGSALPLHIRVAKMIDELGRGIVGTRRYSSIGAVVGATYPAQSIELRRAMPRNYFLVPGYGSQGGTADDVVSAFADDGLGAVVAASRSLTYAFGDLGLSEVMLRSDVGARTRAMNDAINGALARVGKTLHSSRA